MSENKEITVMENNLTLERDSYEIRKMICIIRGKQIMMDSDLAVLYQVDTGNLNKAMKRNQKRFPEDFCFQLSKEEYENLKFQNGSSSEEGHGGRRKLPYVYTEQGTAMLSAVLHSDIAIQVSIRIMKTFVEMRKYLADNSLLLEKVNNLEVRQIEAGLKQERFSQQTNERFEQVFNYIESRKENHQKIFYDGQVFDAFSLMTELVQQADRDIILIDGYVDIVTLNILAKKKAGVKVICYTLPNAKLTQQDIINFNAQYAGLEVKRTKAFHDRFLLLDGIKGYHVGASLKDAGKKCFAINGLQDIGVIKDLMQRAALTSESLKGASS